MIETRIEKLEQKVSKYKVDNARLIATIARVERFLKNQHAVFFAGEHVECSCSDCTLKRQVLELVPPPTEA